MTQIQQGKLPFCGLTLKLYSTGNQAPKMEYQASSNKAQFQCTLTKNMFDLTNIQGWLNTPQVQEYVRSGHVLKWGAKTTQSEANKYSNGMGLEVTYYMVKPFSKAGYNPQPTMQQPMTQQPQQSYQQAKQGVQLTDDKLPVSPREEIDWSKESPTDFNPDMYERELG
jgi:hypothetical protein